MTTVVALYTPDKGSIIACDSQTTMDNRRGSMGPSESKIIVFNNWAVGITGNMTVVNMVDRYRKILLDDVDHPWEFTDRIRSVLEDSGFKPMIDEDTAGFPAYSMSFTFASAHGVWVTDGLLAIRAIAPNELTAAGSGSDFALGSSISTIGKPPEKRVELAMEAAIALDVYTGGDIRLYKMT